MAAPISPDAFRSIMRHVPTGVTIVTTEFEGKQHGLTANAFASVSLAPPLVLVCVNRTASSHDYITKSGIFCVNLLAVEQIELAKRFAARGPDDRFAGIPARKGTSGAPVLADVLAYIDCTLVAAHEAGSHTIFIGGVLDAASRHGKPLGYFDGDYRDFGQNIGAPE